ncbi:MAG: DUF3343 domain-containing protein [Anaerovoracaceae bacterium]|jgi:hypothetical protein
MNEYVIAFSSFYRAMYAQEKLQENRIRADLRKIPPNVLKSCGYAVYLRTESIAPALKVLAANQITPRGVYVLENRDGSLTYRQIA